MKVSELPRKNITVCEDIAFILEYMTRQDDMPMWRLLDAFIRLGMEVCLNEDPPPDMTALAESYLRDAGLPKDALERVRLVFERLDPVNIPGRG